MTELDSESQRRKVLGYARQLPDLYFSCDQKLTILEALNTEGVARQFNDGNAAPAYMAICFTLFVDAIRDICAFVLDSETGSASLRRVIEMLGLKPTLAAARERYATPQRTPLGLDYSEEERSLILSQLVADRVQKEADFDQRVASLQAAKETMRSEAAKRLMRARNKAIAHYEMIPMAEGMPLVFNLADSGLTWGSPREFLNSIEPHLFNAVLIATGDHYPVEEFRRANQLYSADFAARIIGRG